MLLKSKIRKLLKSIGPEISEKFSNINGKTAQGDVPPHYFRGERLEKIEFLSLENSKKKSIKYSATEYF